MKGYKYTVYRYEKGAIRSVNLVNTNWYFLAWIVFKLAVNGYSMSETQVGIKKLLHSWSREDCGLPPI